LEPASHHLMPGIPVLLSPGVRRIVAPNAGMMTGPGTNTYLLGVQDIVVVDPAPVDAQHLQAIMAAAAEGIIRWVFVTHTHRDHSPLAAVLAERTGARLIGMPPPDDGRQDESFRPDHVPRDGERLQLGEIALTAIHTPGHASNCICYLLEDQQLLFTGNCARTISSASHPVTAESWNAARTFWRRCARIGWRVRTKFWRR